MKQKDERGTVWFIHPYSVPPEYPASTRHYYLGYELAKRGWDIYLWQSSFIHPLKRYRHGCGRKLLVKEKREQMNLYWLWGPPYQMNNWRRSLNMLVWPLLLIPAAVLQQKPKLIVGSSPHIFGALAGLAVSKIFRVPFVLEVRDLWPDTLSDMGALSKGLVSKLLYKLEEWLYKGSYRIISLTEGIGKRIINKGIDSSKIAFIPNGIHLHSMSSAKWTGQSSEIRKKLNLEDKFVCIYTGAHGPANALDVLIDTAFLLKDEQDIIFLLVGEGQEKPRLVQKVEQLGLNNIIFHDPVPHSDIGNFIREADLCILTLKDVPVFETALPNKLFDYMNENKPVICAVKGETAELVVKEQLGVVIPPGDSKEMAEAILQLKKDPALLNKYGRRGRSTIEKKYSFEKLSVDMENVFLCALGKDEQENPCAY